MKMGQIRLHWRIVKFFKLSKEIKRSYLLLLKQKMLQRIQLHQQCLQIRNQGRMVADTKNQKVHSQQSFDFFLEGIMSWLGVKDSSNWYNFCFRALVQFRKHR